LLDQSAADALPAERWCNDNHGEVAIGQTVRYGARETNNLATWRHCNDGALAGGQKRSELRKRADTGDQPLAARSS
jgi:hypothetical protein